MKKDKLGFGIIGCGLISNWHAKAILQVNQAWLVGCTDVCPESYKDFAKSYNIIGFESVEELLKSPDVDVVCICTPSGLHAPLAIQAANKGKHILVEKPMALNLSEADEVIRACELNKVKMSVVSQLRFSEAVIKLKKAVEKGLLGTLVMGDISMKYYRSQEYYDKGGWRGTWKMDGGGALMNQGIHGIDLLQYVMGPVKSVFANARTLVRKIEVEDTIAATLEFENGALGIIQATTSIYPGSPRRLEVNGSKGSIVLEEDCIIKWDIEGEEMRDDICESTQIKASSDPAAINIQGHIKQISDTVDAIINNKMLLIDQYEGRKPLEIIMAVYESSRTGQLIRL